jgi:putative FmdB family regulatory protein
MPLYEYQCDACGTRLEKIRKFSDPPLEICEKCGGKLTKLVSSPAFQFKGSGWYVTDYARKAEPGSTSKKDDGDKAPAAAESTSGKKDDTSKSDVKKGDAPAGEGKPAAAATAKE